MGVYVYYLSFTMFRLLGRSLIRCKILFLFCKTSESFSVHATHACVLNSLSLNGILCLEILLLTSKLAATTVDEFAKHSMMKVDC
jgi:hypothetical protein